MERGDDRPPPDVPIEGEKKITIVGHKGCGKTCLIASFVTESPVYSTRTSPKEVRRIIDFGREWVHVVLRETDPKYPLMRRAEYRGTSAVLVCFSFNDIESIRSVPAWIDEVREHCRTADLSVVGCKLDTKHKMDISPTEWTCIEKAITPYRYLECSARTGEGVAHLVRVVGNALLDQPQSENAWNNSVVQQ